MGDKEHTYVYRSYEADELYLRCDIHGYNNLAALPDYADMRARVREVALNWMFETADTLPWYMDARNPQVVLDSPQEQFLSRIPDRENCRSKSSCTEDIITSSRTYVVRNPSDGVWDSVTTSNFGAVDRLRAVFMKSFSLSTQTSTMGIQLAARTWLN